MPDEFSFRRVLGSDFINVLRVVCVAICDARKTSPSICTGTIPPSPLRVFFPVDKLCSFLRGRNHGDLSQYPRSYYYLRANILRRFSPLQETLPRDTLYITKCSVCETIIKLYNTFHYETCNVQKYCNIESIFNLKKYFIPESELPKSPCILLQWFKL